MCFLAHQQVACPLSLWKVTAHTVFISIKEPKGKNKSNIPPISDDLAVGAGETPKQWKTPGSD